MTALTQEDERVTVLHGDCIELMRTLPDNSIDSIVTDPPYGLGFMGKAWDDLPPGLPWAQECLRVLKPGGHLVAFGGTRTFHRLAVAIEDAGFEIRDSIAWLYGSGFPKSLDVSKAIDKAAGAERDRIPRIGGALNAGTANGWSGSSPDSETAPLAGTQQVDTPATEAARAWQGWGTALKPAFEPVVVARKPLIGTVAVNVLAHGTGALNVDATRVAHASEADLAESTGKNQHAKFGTEPGGNAVYGDFSQTPVKDYDGSQGRWPANVVLDESQAEVLDQQSGIQKSGVAVNRNRSGEKPNTIYGTFAESHAADQGYGDVGGASRFFYCAKAPAKERPKVDGVAHPTVKPLTLMRWLVRLVTPPGGVVLDTFAGSGTTVEACLVEGFQCIAIEREPDYLPLIDARLVRNGHPAATPTIAAPGPTPELTVMPAVETVEEAAVIIHLAPPSHLSVIVGEQDSMFEVNTPPVKVPKRRADNGHPRWSAYNPANRVKCDDCMLVLLESKGEGPAALPAHWKRIQSGVDLLLCYSHARARRKQDGLELLEGM